MSCMKLEANSSNSNCQGWFCTIGLSDALLGRSYCSSSDNIHYVGCLGIWLGLSNFPLMCLHNHAYNHVSQRSLYFSLFQKNGIRILMWFDINVYNKYNILILQNSNTFEMIIVLPRLKHCPIGTCGKWWELSQHIIDSSQHGFNVVQAPLRLLHDPSNSDKCWYNYFT